MDLEEILDVMGCKTRRDILTLLRDEPRFVSQISQELAVGQKAIIEHLRSMEEAGIISSSFQKIERGRPRKYYDILQDIEIHIFIEGGVIRMNPAIYIPLNEFSPLQGLESRALRGENVIEDLKELIRLYGAAKEQAENLLKSLEHKNRIEKD
jgi:ArsR family transcriptional regulator